MNISESVKVSVKQNLNTNVNGGTMDISKWKSVAVKKETHTLLQGLCNEKERNPARMISKLVKDYMEYQAKKKGMTVDKYTTILLQKLKKNGKN
jgi:hypothetical protein|tara:strand:+ start:1003 stop:1284 length:282 start_codon:yes stop_codon:yes gene_type:complete